MNILNPIYKIQNPDRNIFTLRQIEYDQLQENIYRIAQNVQEIGFSVKDCELLPARTISSELMRTLKHRLILRLQKGKSIIDLSMYIPTLIDGNFLFINGRRKIPLFQLFDIPLMVRDKTVKLRTNIATIMVTKESEIPRIRASFLYKKVPLALLMLAFHGPQTIKEKYNPLDFELSDPENMMELLLEDLKVFLEESSGYTQDDFIHELGRIYSRYDAATKGNDVVFALELIPKIDFLSMQFFHADSVLDELIYGLQHPEIDDLLLTNKRIRCWEYIVYAKLMKNIFEFCLANRTARQPKFNINSSQIISACNISEIVQFDFSINPIDELTKLSRTSLLGPGGFKRENIPHHLRDIVPSMFGRMCPVDTPDRDNCGVLQSLVPNVHLEENGRFSEDIVEDQPISIPVSMVPFLEHDDQTRLQMAASQMRQAIMLRDFDKPLISSGCEYLYTDYTQFVKRAKKDGIVVYSEYPYIIVSYDDGDVDVFDISYRQLYVENMDFMNVYVETGDRVSAGDIVAESNFCKNGHICFGRNLLTGVMIYYGNNYEDGIVISDRLVKEDILTSVHIEDLSFTLPPNKVLLSLEEDTYKPLPDNYERIGKGSPYAIMKNLIKEDIFSPFVDDTKLIADRDFIIPEINIFANEWNRDIPQFVEWIEKKLDSQTKRISTVKEILIHALGKERATKFINEKGLNSFIKTGNYRIKKSKINGVHFQMYGIHFRKVKVGDKLANRHGNKGVISRIVPHEKMPQMEDGRHLDICINPLGIVSRMNLGQLFELHLSMAVSCLKTTAMKMLQEGKSQQEIKDFIIGFVRIVDKTRDGWYLKQFEENLPSEIDEKFLSDFTILQPPFESCKLDDVIRAMEYTGAKFKEKIFDPLSKQYLSNPIAVGYLYFLRMVHIAEEKLAARGIGSYSKRTLQPVGGRRNKGGQRCGEMETACIIAHDAPENLHEFFTMKSDCIDLKNAYIREVITGTCPEEGDATPETVKLFQAYLKVLGVE